MCNHNGNARRRIWSPRSIMDIFTLAQVNNVAIEVDWREENQAFVIAVRKGTFKDCTVVSAEKLECVRDDADYIKNLIRNSIHAVNRAYE